MFDKEILKLILVEWHNRLPRKNLLQRGMEFESGMNYALTGMRRVGKSCCLFQDMEKRLANGILSKEEILYFNFEDERLYGLDASDLNLLLECHAELFGVEKPRIYLDEIQNINGWEKFVRRLCDYGYEVLVTGSNSRMLSHDIATTLGGRVVVRDVYPFSFQEFLLYHGLEIPANWKYDSSFCTRAACLFKDYFIYGGLCESFLIQEKQEWLSGLYQKILLGDIAANNHLRSTHPLRLLGRKLADSVMQPTSLSRLVNLIRSTGDRIAQPALTELLHKMQASYLIFPIRNFNSSSTERETIQKHYFTDNGILNILLVNAPERLLENLCAIRLHQEYDTHEESAVFYYNDTTEVDFYIPAKKMALQVSYSLRDQNTRDREIQALLRLNSMHKLESAFIVTMDADETMQMDNLTIQILPIWKWLLTKL